MARFEPTGDPEIDALFANAVDETASEVIEYDGISEEPVKPEGQLQNSGIIVGSGNKVLVPNLSADELERNVPARGKGMVAVKPPEGVSVGTFYLLLSNSYALYLTEGTYSNEALQKRTGFAPGVISKCISSPEFKHALRLRGVNPEATGLTTEQDYALLILSDASDGKNFGQKLKMAGVSHAKYRAWLKQPAFKQQMDAITQGLLHDNSQSLVQLEKLAGQGDLAAIKYKHELNGTYDPNRQNNIDIIALMSMVLDIVARHVKDPVELQKIGSDMRDVAQTLKIGQ